MAEKIVIGKIMVTLEGEWDSTRVYDKYCEVSYQGGSYVSKSSVPVGTLPTNTTYWQQRATKGTDGIDGNDGLDAYQPFKGWFNSASDLNTAFASPQVGDYAYVKGATASDPTTIYECTTAGTWALSQREFNPANNQSFASGEELNTTHIIDNLTSSSPTDVLSAKQGKALKTGLDELGLELEGKEPVWDTAERVSLFRNSSGIWKSSDSYEITILPVATNDVIDVEWDSETRRYLVENYPVVNGGVSNVLETNSATGTEHITSPINGYFCISSKHNDVTHKPEELSINNNDLLIRKEGLIARSASKFEQIDEATYKIEQIQEQLFISKKVDENSRIRKAYLSSSDGSSILNDQNTNIKVYVGDYSNKTIIVSGRVPKSSDYAMVCFYQSDGTFISSALIGDDIAAKSFVDEELTCPQGTGIVKVSGTTNYQDSLLTSIFSLKEFLTNEEEDTAEEVSIFPSMEYGSLNGNRGGFSEMQSAAGGSSVNYGLGLVRTPKYIQIGKIESFKIKSDRTVWYRAFFYESDYSFINASDWDVLTANTEAVINTDSSAYVRFHFREDSQNSDMPLFTIELKGAFSNDCEKYNIRSADDGYQTISVGIRPINGGVSNNETDLVQDNENYSVDYGILALPTTYRNTGKPTRLIIYCHGAGVNYGSSDTRFPSTDCRPEYWLSEGYAVMDMDGEFYSSNHQHTYLPEARQSYVAAYRWIINNYNICKDGVFVGGRSMGGGMCFELLDSQIPIIAACPVVPVCNTLWWWNYSNSQYRTDCAEKMGFVGEHTWGSSDPMSQSDWDFLYTNFDKMVKYAPFWRCIMDLPQKETLFNGTNIRTKTTTGDAVEAEAEIYANLHARVKAPVKFFDNYSDPTVPYERNALLMYRMLVNSGQITELRMFDVEEDEDTSITAHHFELRTDRLVEWTNSFGVTMQNVPVVYIEMLAFWRRYEQVNGSY